MPKGSSGKDSSENIQLEPLSRASRQNESADTTEDVKAPLRHTRKTCDLGTYNMRYFAKFW